MPDCPPASLLAGEGAGDATSFSHTGGEIQIWLWMGAQPWGWPWLLSALPWAGHFTSPYVSFCVNSCHLAWWLRVT